MDAESDDGTVVSTIIAYDINLMYDGVKLDNSWAEMCIRDRYGPDQRRGGGHMDRPGRCIPNGQMV